jgi:small conductance mechanosensitive channel
MEKAWSIIDGHLLAMADQAIGYLPAMGIAILIILATRVADKILDRIIAGAMGRARMRRSLVEVVQKLTSVLIWIFGLLIATTVIFPSMTPGRLVTAVGLGSIAIGFAFKDIFENFIAGILILFREPFRLGDYIECSSIEGQVERITIRDTHIRQVDGQRVVIPNAVLFKDPVTVRTDQDLRRTTIICGVAYGEDVDKAREVIRRAVEPLRSVRTDPPVQIFAQAFGSSSIDFEVTWWTGSRPIDIRCSRDEVVAAVKRGLDTAGIEIPFPYRTLTFKEPLPVPAPQTPGRAAADPSRDINRRRARPASSRGSAAS